MDDMNTDIIFIRLYGGSLIPISKVNLVTVDPNSGKPTQELPLIKCIEDLMQYNMHSFQKIKENWTDLESYDIVKKV